MADSLSTDVHSDMPSAPQFKPRRPHAKSRNGCVRCKQQRKKCDAVKPRCSRCAAHDHCCQYTKRPLEFKISEEPRESEPATSGLDSIGFQLPSLTSSHPSNSSASSDCLPSASSTSFFGSLSPYPTWTEGEVLQSDSQPSEMLDLKELALLSHYLTHTGRGVAFDEDDLYVLQVGVPNLAFNSKPLMSSLLALAAACQCNDIMKRSSAPLESLGEIRELLRLADRHHRSSLRQIQDTIPTTDCYDQVLANAALMVLYSSASHSIRVRLVEAAKSMDKPLLTELLPAQSQWIALIRAAHAAYVGLLNGPNNFSGSRPARTSNSRASSPPRLERLSLSGNDVSPSEDGPSEETKNLYLPIVAATCGPALEKLRAKAQSVVMPEYYHVSATPPVEDYYNQPRSPVGCKSALQICLASLDTLEDVVATVFPNKLSNPEEPQQSVIDDESPLLGRLSEISPWLRRYLARVTSTAPSKPLRRKVMAFVNRVPLEYLNFVESILEVIPIETERDNNLLAWDMTDSGPSPSNATHRLAMEIFAHWLVLVMLLDGVWWIGDIGEWELGRVVWFMRTQAWSVSSARTGERWWPESMLKVKKELAEHTKEG